MLQIVHVNSALSQNWVGCTVCTPKAQAASAQRQGRAYAARALHSGRVHNAVSWLTGSRIVAAGRRIVVPGHRVVAVSQAVSRAMPRVVLSPPGHDTKIVSRLNPYRAHCAFCCACYSACRSAPAPYRRALLHCNATLPRRIATPKVAPYHDTKIVL